MRLPVCALLVAILVASAPAGASAASAPKRTQVILTLPKVKGYAFKVTATAPTGDKSGGYGMSYILTKGPQTHGFSFEGAALDFRPDLGSGKVRLDAGGKGKSDLRFQPSGPARSQAAPGDCTGKSRVRAGVFTGTFRFVVDHTFFKTVTARRIKGTVALLPKGCSGDTDDLPEKPLFLTFGELRAGVYRRDSGLILAVGKGGGNGSHSVVVDLPSSAYSVSADRKSATVQGVAPVRGSLHFSATKADRFQGHAEGSVTGDLSMDFDSAGRAAIRSPQKARIWFAKETAQKPVADFTFESIGTTCGMRFHGRSTEPNGPIKSYSWNFGGRSSSDNDTTADPLVFYDAPGTYEVTLYVLDEAGQQASATKSVDVPPSPDGYCEATGRAAPWATTRPVTLG